MPLDQVLAYLETRQSQGDESDQSLRQHADAIRAYRDRYGVRLDG